MSEPQPPPESAGWSDALLAYQMPPEIFAELLGYAKEAFSNRTIETNNLPPTIHDLVYCLTNMAVNYRQDRAWRDQQLAELNTKYQALKSKTTP